MHLKGNIGHDMDGGADPHPHQERVKELFWAKSALTPHAHVRLVKPGEGLVLKGKDPCSVQDSTLQEQDCMPELLSPWK